MFKKNELLMGIDAGTESVRVGLYDLEGNEIAFAATPYPTYHPQNGWAEQDPHDWWSSLIASVKKALQNAGVTKDYIKGISLDATACSVVLCMNDGTPLRRSLIWMDVRASEEARFISSIQNDSLKYNGYGNVSPEWMPCKALWLKKNEPENYHKAEKILEFADWYMYKLTGRWTGNICNTTTRWYYNRHEGGWPVEFYESIDLGDILEKFPKEIYDLGEPIGGLTKEAAKELGLNEGTPVGQGGVDAFIGLIGLGVTEPGRIGLITGTSHCIMALSKDEFHAPGVFGSFPDAVIPGYQMIEGGQISTGAIIKWFKTHFCKDLEEEAERQNMSVYDLLTPLAQKLPPGSEDLLVLDYWQGNRTPHVDPNIRGLIYGLSLNHRREHIFRAIMEGIAYGTEQILQVFKKNGIDVQEISIAGGATNSPLYLQIHADVSNLPIYVPNVLQAPCLGSAILASVGSGYYSNIQEAAKNMVHYNKCIEPIQENHEKYQAFTERYMEAYPLFQSWMKRITNHASNG